MAVRKLSVVLDLDSGQFTTRVREANGSLKTLSSSAMTAGSRIDGVAASARRGRDSIEAINKAVWKLQLTLASATFLFGGFTANLVKTNAEAQRSMALLEGLSKAADKFGRHMEAASDFKFLRNFAKTAPYDMKTLTDVFVKFRSAGVDPTNGSMRALVDAVAQFGGDSDILHRASIAIQQMAGKGTVSMEELRQQLGEAVPTALRTMAQAAGKSVPDFVKEVSKGNVMWKDVQDKFFTLLEQQAKGASERLMKTLGGQTQQMKTNIQNLMLAIGGFQSDGTFANGGFMSTLTEGAKDFNSWLSDPKTLQGAREFGATLANLLKTAQAFATFLTKNGDTLMFFAKAFVLVKGIELTRLAMERLAVASLATATAQKGVVKEAMSAKAAQLSAALAHDKAAVAASESANAVAAASRRAADAIQIQVAALREEQAAYQANIALATAQRQAAARQVETGRDASGRFVSRADAAGDRNLATRAVIQNRRQLTRVTAELDAAEASLMSATRGAVVAEETATVAAGKLTLANRVATVAARGFTAVMGGLSAMLGGPLGIAMIAITIGLTGMVGAMNKADQATTNLKDEIKASHETLIGIQKLSVLAKNGVGDLGAEAEDSGKKVKAFAGEVGAAAQKLYDLAEARRVNAIGELNDRNRKLANSAVEADKHSLTGIFRDRPSTGGTHIASPKEFFNGAFNVGGAGLNYLYTGGKSEREARAAVEAAKSQMMANRAEIARLQEIDPKTGLPKVTQVIGQNMRNSGEFTGDDTSKSGKKGKVTPDQRLEAHIDQLKASKDALLDFVRTEDAGAAAADKLTGKLDGQSKVNKKVSEGLKDRAVEEARMAANADKARQITDNVFQDARENASNAKEAIASMGDSFDGTTNAIEKFDRKASFTEAELKKLWSQAFPNTTDGAAELQMVLARIEQSKADFKIARIADATRQLADELHDMQIENVDPDTQALNGLVNHLDKIRSAREAASKLPEGDEKGDILKRLDSEEAGFRAEHQRRIEAATKEETRAILEGLMTQEQAAKAHMDRELARIDKLAQAGVMSTQVSEEAKAAIRAQYERDTESEAQRMLREWTDVTGELKKLSGQWLDDLMDKLLEGKFSFKDFALSVLKDWLTTIAKAKMAQAIQPLIDAGENFLIHAASAFVGAPTAHTGRGPGDAPSMYRMVDPRMFMGAPKFHNGKMPQLGAHEMAAIIRKDEGVFTPAQMRALGKGGGGAPNVQVNVINETGTAMDAQQQGGPRFDGEKYIVDVLVDQASRPGRVRNALLNVK